MAKPTFLSVDQYIASLPPETQAVLQTLRGILRRALPADAEEAISYSIPAFKLHGKVVLWFAAWQQHYSLYPAGPSLQAAFGKEIAAYQVTKGTIRFPLSERIPKDLITRIAIFRTQEAEDRQQQKAGRQTVQKKAVKKSASVKKTAQKKTARKKAAKKKAPPASAAQQ